MAMQEIKCNVHTCRHHDNDQHCALRDITVGNTVTAAHDKQETECASFDVK